MKKITVPVIIASALLITFGVCSRPFLGDEIYHLRFAKDTYSSNSRPIFDSQYGTRKMPTILYTTPPFWSLSLALLWKFTGGMSIFVAQFYQAIFYIIVIISTYLIARELYSEQVASISCLCVATVPMIVSFSIILYTDVPVIALSLTAIFFVIKKRYLIAGSFWAIALLTKYNTGFFLPAALLILLVEKDQPSVKKLKNSVLMFSPPCILFFLDHMWRSEMFPKTSAVLLPKVLTRVATFKTSEYLCSHLLNLKDLMMYLGAVFMVVAVLYFLKKKYEKKDMYLGLFIISYILCTFVLLGWNTDIRYFMPAIPLLCILFTKSLTDINNEWTKRFLIYAGVLQFVATASFVHYVRNITPQLEEGFDFIRNHTPADSLVLYPEPNLQEYAQRKIIWSNFKQSTRPNNIFWPEELNEIRNAICLNDIDYIVIKKTRCYNDEAVRHIGGYPTSFVQKLPEYKFVKLIFDNNEIAVWEIEKQYL
jgi:hypothetical protein